MPSKLSGYEVLGIVASERNPEDRFIALPPFEWVYAEDYSHNKHQASRKASQHNRPSESHIIHPQQSYVSVLSPHSIAFPYRSAIKANPSSYTCVFFHPIDTCNII
ncbi:hypothetical protein VTL71DRAFT_15105 [Oculimacula yallundae]|uniref:Uncharacterized protein n=1 Tax=Oculimacula yallundae TaxID=86028 RepID=A0ABR4CFL5_9HELO